MRSTTSSCNPLLATVKANKHLSLAGKMVYICTRRPLDGKADCAEALLEWGADKDAADDDGDTALHLAASRGQLECARLLVRARADRAKKSNKGQTALELAREYGKAEVAALLEQADADVRCVPFRVPCKPLF